MRRTLLAAPSCVKGLPVCTSLLRVLQSLKLFCAGMQISSFQRALDCYAIDSLVVSA